MVRSANPSSERSLSMPPFSVPSSTYTRLGGLLRDFPRRSLLADFGDMFSCILTRWMAMRYIRLSEKAVARPFLAKFRHPRYAAKNFTLPLHRSGRILLRRSAPFEPQDKAAICGISGKENQSCVGHRVEPAEILKTGAIRAAAGAAEDLVSEACTSESVGCSSCWF